MKTKILTLLIAVLAATNLAIASDHFVFESKQDGSTVGLAALSSHQTLEFSTDGNKWYPMTAETVISLNNGVQLYVRGKLTGNNSWTDYTQFSVIGSVEARGNINYIWNYEDPDSPLKDFCGISLFKQCEGLSDVSKIKFPSLTLTSGCYQTLFYRCTNIITSPELPATTMADSCYAAMFKGCTKLTTTPVLPATSLADYCYSNMFAECANLTTAPTLPAMILADFCYAWMFNKCTKLTTVPNLPAMNLADHCYVSMFEECTNLTKAPALPATTLATCCYQRMFFGCKGLPAAPVLPAANLVEGCYYKMFKQCSNLKSIKCLATSISAENCLTEWVKTIPSSGTFTRHKNTSSWPSGMNGIPSGWTTKQVQPYFIYFDANGGLIPSEGNMGDTPATHATSLSGDHKTGYVVVYSDQTSFNSMVNDCATREGHIFLGWYTGKTNGAQVYDNTGRYVESLYWDSNGKWIGTADLQLYAHWQTISYTITWLNDDGSLFDKTFVPYGQIPTHVAPTKAATAEYTYTFAGWTPDVEPVTGDATYTATFTAHPITEAVEDIHVEGNNAVKVLHDGHIYILRGEKIYTLQGKEVK